jgi:hypothetical protein
MARLARFAARSLAYTHAAIIALTLAFIVVLAISPARAQGPTPTTDAPRYFLTIVTRGVDASNRLNLEVAVSNVGGATPDNAVLELLVLENGAARPLASATIGALPFAGQARVSMSAPLDSFPGGSRQVFDFRVLQADGQTPADFAAPAQFAVTIPDANGAGQTGSPTLPAATLALPPAPGSAPAADAVAPVEATAPAVGLDDPLVIRIPLPGDDLLLDLGTRREAALTTVLVGGGALLLWLFTLLLRALFRRPPQFGTQQAPYASMPPFHPQSQSGIRQAWQAAAQNNAITMPPTPGAATAVKRLVGADGAYLSGWRITALRLSQYDQYGRIARSQLLPSRRWVRRLDRLARRAGQLDARRLERRAAPIGRALARAFLKKVSRRSAMLPIALDVRLVGTHGEVNIVFEVYGAVAGGAGLGWGLLDQWLPEMTVTAKTIYESYTYTLYGQTGGETWRAFRRRLPGDLTRALALLIEARPPEVASTPPHPARRAATPEAAPRTQAGLTPAQGGAPAQSPAPPTDSVASVEPPESSPSAASTASPETR